MTAKSNNASKGRYGFGGGVVDYGKRLGWWDRINIPKSTTDIRIVVEGKYVNRPDLIAYDVYGAATLQWLVLQYNNIIDIQEELVAGAELSLPTKARVMTEILTTRQQTLTRT